MHNWITSSNAETDTPPPATAATDTATYSAPPARTATSLTSADTQNRWRSSTVAKSSTSDAATADFFAPPTANRASSTTANTVRHHISPPPFYADDPEIWLMQLNIYFSQAEITHQDTRFRLTSMILSGDLLREFTDILRNPTRTPYDTLVEAIRQRSGQTVEQRIRTLLSGQ